MKSERRVPVVLLTAEVPDAELIEHYAKSADESLTVLAASNGATSAVFDEHAQRLLVLSVPRVVEYRGDISRVLGVAPEKLPRRPHFWTEGSAQFADPSLGLAIATALAEHCGGALVVRSTGDVV